MSAAQSIEFETETASPAALWQIADAERALADLFNYCERLHAARIEHEAHSCVLCFETR